MATIRAQRCAYKNNCYKSIISHLVQTNANKKGDTVSLIDGLKIIKVFKNKDKKEGVSIMDFIN